MNGLPARLPQRLLALGVLAAAVLLLWAAFLHPLSTLIDGGDDDLARSLKLIAAYERSAAARPLLEARIQALHQREASLAGLLDGATTAVAAANLQGEVKKIIESHHGAIRSAQNLPAAAPGENFERIEIRDDLAAPMSDLGPLLHAIETHQPYLFVDTLVINAPDSAKPEAAAADPKLVIGLGVAGYRRAAAP